jgi:hypothetical protein
MTEIILLSVQAVFVIVLTVKHFQFKKVSQETYERLQLKLAEVEQERNELLEYKMLHTAEDDEQFNQELL